MAKTFIRGALTGFLFGPLSAFILWVVLSAAISVEILVVSILLGWNGQTPLSLDVIINWNTNTLTSLPYFSLLDYVQIMWAGLLLPILIAGAMYVIVLAQGTTETRIVSFFGIVVRDVLLSMALLTMIWILAGAFYGLYHDSAILNNQNTALGQFWTNFTSTGDEGLQKVGLYGFKLSWETIMNDIFPYIPIPFYLLAYFWLFSNIHAGWIGNIWGGAS